MRSCSAPMSVASVGWYPTADGIRPSSAETSEPAWVKRKMLSTKNSTSCPWSRKCSDREARERDPHARAGRLVHLSEHQRAFRFHALIGIVGIGVDLRFDELVIEIVALAGAF